MLGKVLGWLADRDDGSVQGMGGPHRVRLGLEALEPRILLSGIQGHVWEDVDGDAVWDGREPGLEGWTVYLDQNENGVRHFDTFTRGTELPVNTWDLDEQENSSVAMDAGGSFVIAWESRDKGGQDDGIFAQRYAADGTPVESEFRVNTYTKGNQEDSSVAMDDGGNFVITWDSDGQGGDGKGVYAQRYAADGTPLGSKFQVNTYITGNQRRPTVAMDAVGDFVVTWESYGQDGDDWGIYAQRYAADGTPVESEFRVNTYTKGNQEDSSVGMDAGGSFLITWRSWGQDGDGHGDGIYAQAYAADGTPLGSEFQVNTYTTDDQNYPSMAMDADGDFVITWRSDGQDGSGYGVFAKQFARSGASHTVTIGLGQVASGINFGNCSMLNYVPVPNAGGPYEISEGDTLVLDGSGSSDPDGDPLTYAWDLDDDGAFDDATGVNPTITWAELNALGISDGTLAGSTFAVALQVDDGQGGSGEAETSLTLLNAPPTAGVSGPGKVFSGQNIELSVSANDESPDDQSGGFIYEVDWGDGTVDTLSGGDIEQAPHVYEELGTFTVEVTATDKDGGVSAIATHDVEVRSRGKGKPRGSLATLSAGAGDDILVASGVASSFTELDLRRILWDWALDFEPDDGTDEDDVLDGLLITGGDVVTYV